MKKYFKRLRRAIRNKNYYSYYDEDTIYTCRELDDHIIKMLVHNLPLYTSGYPCNSSQEERDKKKLEVVAACKKLLDEKGYRLGWLNGTLEYKPDFETYCANKKTNQDTIKDFLHEHFFNLWD